MQNKIPDALPSVPSVRASKREAPPRPLRSSRRDGQAASGLARRAVDRTLAARRSAAEAEVERLVAATFHVIERTGSLEPKVSEILAEAGLSNQAFYRRFEGKHALLVAVLDQGIRRLADHLATRMAEADSAVDAIRAWVRGMAAQARDPSGARASRPFALARGRLSEKFPDEVAESESEVTAPLRRALAAARDAGELSAHLHPEQLAEMLYHLTMGWVEARLVEGRIPTDDEVERLEVFVVAGLASMPARRGEETTQPARLGGASLHRDGRRDGAPAAEHGDARDGTVGGEAS